MNLCSLSKPLVSAHFCLLKSLSVAAAVKTNSKSSSRHLSPTSSWKLKRGNHDLIWAAATCWDMQNRVTPCWTWMWIPDGSELRGALALLKPEPLLLCFMTSGNSQSKSDPCLASSSAESCKGDSRKIFCLCLFATVFYLTCWNDLKCFKYPDERTIICSHADWDYSNLRTLMGKAQVGVEVEFDRCTASLSLSDAATGWLWITTSCCVARCLTSVMGATNCSDRMEAACWETSTHRFVDHVTAHISPSLPRSINS